MEIPADLVGAAIVAAIALVCGFALRKQGHPDATGQLAVGIICGPSLFGLMSDRVLIETAFPIAALLAMFVLGTTLSLRRALAAWRIALSVSLSAALAFAVLAVVLSPVLAYSASEAVALGFVLAASGGLTIAALLSETSQSGARGARLARSALLVQALTLPIMIEIAAWFGGSGLTLGSLLACMIYLAVAVALVGALGTRRRPVMPFAAPLLAELGASPLVPLLFAFIGAAVFGVLGLSIAFGIVVAGIVLANCAESREMARAIGTIGEIARPFFFVLLGLMVDVRLIMDHLLTALVLIALASVGRAVLLIALHRAAGEEWRNAYVQGLVLAPAGEIGIVVAITLLGQGAIGPVLVKLAIAAIAVNVLISPILGAMAGRVRGAPAHAAADWRTLRDVAVGTLAAGRGADYSPAKNTAAEPPTATTLAEIGDKVRAAAGMAESAPSPDAPPPGERDTAGPKPAPGGSRGDA